MQELAAGTLIVKEETYIKLVMKVMRDPTPTMPGVPQGFDAVIQRTLMKEREQRYQTIAELAQALEPFAGNRGEAAALVQRCVALAAQQRVRVATPPAGVPAQSGLASPPAHGSPAMSAPFVSQNTPPRGQPPMNTPAYGQSPMNTPVHGQPPMNTPAHGQPPMSAPFVSQNTPARGQPPMTTPAHGMPYAQVPRPASAGTPAGRGRIFWIVLIGVIAGSIAGVVLLLTN